MKEKLKKIGAKFRLPGELADYEVVKRGNINSTYCVTYENDGRKKNYMFQKVNTFVFKDPEKIMENIDHVTSHILRSHAGVPALHFHHTDEGQNFIFDDDGSFWRVMNAVDSVTFDTCDDLEIVQYTGEAFGRFQMQLSDFDASLLHETIPDFHNTKKRLDTLFRHVEEDPCERVTLVSDEIAYIASVRERAGELSERYAAGEFPLRVTHNDTKANNVLFDPVTKKPLVVIDLDTVMPGMAMYDFGDAVRFIANTAEEDEKDITKVSFDTAKFRAFCKGYISQVWDALTPDEIESLVPACFAITIELASRFLDDYLTGDKYFKVCYPEHNVVRTRCQLALAKDIDKKSEELAKIVDETFAEAKSK
jgi:Ser/Thr protein kinase RdoA (MazF antagonist)